ncbi:MAG: hypothetical protein LDL31_13080, partial [Prosthecobacter sp.]|nr:hypothetical protein [Prosthecobacter sp.]
MKNIYRISLAILSAALLSNCALGTTQINVSHSPLQPAPVQRSGTIIVKPFTDSRKVDDKKSIGNKRNGYGMVLGGFATQGGRTVAEIMTEHVADALRAAGYQAVVEGASGSSSSGTVLEGDVYEFWLDMFTACWHNVGVDVSLKKGSSVVWRKKFDGSETNVLWVGLNSEIEKVVRQALDKALNAAVKEFSSADFASK